MDPGFAFDLGELVTPLNTPFFVNNHRI